MNEKTSKNPLKAVFDLKRADIGLSLLMFSYFFLVITTFWILKPIKKTIFIGYYEALEGFDLFGWHLTGAQAEMLAKVLNMVVAFAAVAVFTLLARKLRRQQLTLVFSLFFFVSFVLYRFIINSPADVTVWSFYLFGDLYATLMVATFFAFLNDSVNSSDAKRLYGIIGLGGVSGGVFGTMIVRVWIEKLEPSDWLLICFGIGVLILACAVAAGRIVSSRRDGSQPPAQTERPERTPEESDSQPPRNDGKSTVQSPKKKQVNAAIEGARLVFRSRYLLSVVGIVGLYEIVSTVLDYQFTETLAHYLEGDELKVHFSTVYLITAVVALFVQLFLTSFFMMRLGITRALFVLPVVILLASVGYMALPILWAGSLLNTADNGFSYSINQSSKEALYVPTTEDEKYKAKAFIDMFVQRFAKAIAVGVTLLITTIFTDFSALRWLSLFPIAVILLWFVAVRFAGRKFDELAEKEAAPGSS